jgi:hypothetical protein
MDARMARDATYLPGFRRLCTVVSVLYLLLAGSMLARGARVVMKPLGVPESVLSSAHFADFFHWLFVHMAVIGILIGMLGRFVEEGRHQRTVARVLCLLEAHYTYLDVSTSDSRFGNALYRGPGSLVPPMIDLVVLVAFAYFGMKGLKAREPGVASGNQS